MVFVGTLYGAPINIGHTDDSYNTAILDLLGYSNIHAMCGLLDNSNLVGTKTVTEGHKHSGSIPAQLQWMQLTSCSLADNVDNTDEIAQTGTYISSASGFLVYAIVPIVIPDGSALIKPAIRAAVPGIGDVLTVVFDFDSPATVGQGAIPGVTMFVSGAQPEEWFVSGAYTDVSAVPLVDGYRLVYMRVRAQIGPAPASAILYNIQVVF